MAKGNRTNMKGKALGRGLSALIPGAEDISDEGLLELTLDVITENPFQPRDNMDPDSLRELAESIRQNGVIQPVAVCKRDDGYQLIAGGRRFKAARIAGLRTIPAVLIQVDSDAQMLELAIVENLQREDLNPLELAKGYKRLMDDCGLTQEEVADKVGKQRPTISNFLRLLNLPEAIQQGLKDGVITTGHAKALMVVEDSKLQMELYTRCVAEGLNVRRIEKLSKNGHRPRKTVKPEIQEDPYIRDFENRLRTTLATKVNISPKSKGGVIEISYFSDDELARLVEILEEGEKF